MDLVAACVAFVNVSERGSFTVGAAAARVPQSVASRRIAALEGRLGDQLFDRSSRKATLTPFGRAMLPSAKRLVRMAVNLDADAERARSLTLRLSLPSGLEVGDLARLVADARLKGLRIDIVTADPDERIEQVRSAEVHVALVPASPAEATWSVPLGVASVRGRTGAPFFFDTIRRGRTDTATPPRIWVQAEDDVPGIRDRLTRLRDSHGLAPAQLEVTQSTTTAVAEVYAGRDLLLCAREQADRLGLAWQPFGDIRLVRGYDLAAKDLVDAKRMINTLDDAISQCIHATRVGDAA